MTKESSQKSKETNYYIPDRQFEILSSLSNDKDKFYYVMGY